MKGIQFTKESQKNHYYSKEVKPLKSAKDTQHQENLDGDSKRTKKAKKKKKAQPLKNHTQSKVIKVNEKNTQYNHT